VDIVLPSGIATTASATHNADLFFALKGGFNNFVSLLGLLSNS
jgi:hypothetical protein